MKVYVITAYCDFEEYTPSVFKNKTEAEKRFKELILEEICNRESEFIDENNIERNFDDVTAFAKEEIPDIEIGTNYCQIGEPIDGGTHISMSEVELE